MDGLMVSEVARRAGVSPTTVRFYDREGLLPARRSASGYRLYDDTAIDRLAFIGTAKSLGLLLAEIRDLVEPWQYGRCADVRSAMLPQLERRLGETRDRIEDLRADEVRLDRARDQLAALDREGPCDPSCTRLGREEPVAGPVLAAWPGTDGAPEAVACRLGPGERVDRAGQWRAALAGVTSRTGVPGGVLLTFDPQHVRIGALAELAAETDCCGFLDLSLHLGSPPTLRALAPQHALPLVHELFGPPDAGRLVS